MLINSIIYIASGVVAQLVTKKVTRAVRAEWHLITGRLERIEMIQGVAAENHLTHIQENSSKSVEILTAIHAGQAEANSYLKTLSQK